MNDLEKLISNQQFGNESLGPIILNFLLCLIFVNLVGWFFVIFVMFYYAVRSLWRAMIFLIIVLSIWIRNDAVTAKIKMNLNAGK